MTVAVVHFGGSAPPEDAAAATSAAASAYETETGRSWAADWAAGRVYMTWERSAGGYYLVNIFWLDPPHLPPGTTSTGGELVKSYKVLASTAEGELLPRVYSASTSDPASAGSEGQIPTSDTSDEDVGLPWWEMLLFPLVAVCLIVGAWFLFRGNKVK